MSNGDGDPTFWGARIVYFKLTFVVVEARIEARSSKLEARIHFCRKTSIELPASIRASSPLNDNLFYPNQCATEFSWFAGDPAPMGINLNIPSLHILNRLRWLELEIFPVLFDSSTLKKAIWITFS